MSFITQEKSALIKKFEALLEGAENKFELAALCSQIAIEHKEKNLDIIREELVKQKLTAETNMKSPPQGAHSGYGDIMLGRSHGLAAAIEQLSYGIDLDHQAIIRNQLSPFKNLIAMLENGLLNGTIEMHPLVSQEMQQCKESIEYLSNL